MKFTVKKLEQLIEQELSSLLSEEASTYTELREKLESELKELKKELAAAKKAAKKVASLEKKVQAKQAEIDKLMDSIPSGGDGPVQEQRDQPDLEIDYDSMPAPGTTQELELGPEFGPEGQLKARLKMKDPEGLNKVANAISSGVRYILANPGSSVGMDNPNLKNLERNLIKLLNIVHRRQNDGEPSPPDEGLFQ